MIFEAPDDLRGLFSDGDRQLSVPLPPGRAVFSSEQDLDRPVYWLSDEPAPAGLWGPLRGAHAESGLWPLLLLGSKHVAAESRPWADGEMYPGDMSHPGEHDAASLLARWWYQHTSSDDEDMLSPSERLAVTAPYGRQWPGIAPVATEQIDSGRNADGYAEVLLRSHPGMRLGLVASERGADSLAVAGWWGAANYTNDTAEISAVLRDWEDRFGVRVVGLSGYATLFLSVAAPPQEFDEALRVAAEHFAFCPDNIWQGPRPCTLAAYAERLIGANSWGFWWD
ncbi:DUF4253 domain-containing protein [Micromonospora sp. NPDC094482]|uniref:DUF4253 domain-containing protein n=1 Tax=unclassified Micromonospora TaxID=2617518 RepID=UPI00333333A8